MKGYIFYSKLDSKKEAIGNGTAGSIEEAYKTFAKIKQLPLNEFRRLFEVDLYDKTQTDS